MAADVKPHHEPRISSTAIVEPGVRLGTDVVVWHWVHLRGPSEVGEGVSFGSASHMGPNCRIGRGTRIGIAAQIHEPAVIGARVFIGPNAFLGNDRTPMVGKDWKAQPVVVGDDAVIGAGAKIMGGVTIGAGAVIGMGTVVIRDVPAGEVVVQGPSHGDLRVLRRRPMHGVGTAFEHWGPVGEGEKCWWHDCKE